MERKFHGASHLGRGGIELEPLNTITTEAPVMATVRAIAERLYGEQQAALLVVRCGLIEKGERMAERAEWKMEQLSHLAEALANGASLNELAIN